MFEFNATLIVAMISFVVFMLIMNAIFYRPILNIIRKRDEFVAQNYESAKDMTNRAQEINNEYKTKLDNAKILSREDTIKKMDSAQKKYFEQVRNEKDMARVQIQENRNMIESQKTELYKNIDTSIIDDISSEILKKVMG